VSAAAALLAGLAHPREPVIFALRDIILGTDSSITESVKWNAPSYATTEHFATFHLRAKDAVQLVLHLGSRGRPGVALRSAVPDPFGILDWKGADRAVATFASVADVHCHADALRNILTTWLTFVHAPPGKLPE
jgi:Domain of unknown function (DU1801)